MIKVYCWKWLWSKGSHVVVLGIWKTVFFQISRRRQRWRRKDCLIDKCKNGNMPCYLVRMISNSKLYYSPVVELFRKGIIRIAGCCPGEYINILYHILIDNLKKRHVWCINLLILGAELGKWRTIFYRYNFVQMNLLILLSMKYDCNI